MARSLENFKQKQLDFMFAVELWKKYEHWLIFCALGSERFPLKLWQYGKILAISIRALSICTSRTVNSWVRCRGQQGETVASASRSHTTLVKHIAGVALPRFWTSSDRLSGPCNYLLPELILKMVMLLMEAVSVLSWGMCAWCFAHWSDLYQKFLDAKLYGIKWVDFHTF